jgi:SOS-response transcriptional repressor LexA
MDNTGDLTERQRRVLAYIIECQKTSGIAPTVREICGHFGLRSPGGVHRILNVLKEKGCILSEAGKKRSWRFAGGVPGSGIPLLGDIAAVMVTDILLEATLKVVRRFRQTLILEAANEAYQDLVFKGRSRSQITVLGKYVGIIRKSG